VNSNLTQFTVRGSALSYVALNRFLAVHRPLVRKMQKTDIPLAPSGLLLTLLLCAGCTGNTLSENIASWQGSHIDEVASAWGDPNECEIEDGQRVWLNGAAPTGRPNPTRIGEGTPSRFVAKTESDE
jgi:hypothetical protein